MLSVRQFWILTAAAMLAALLGIANMVIFTANRNAQAEIAARQEYIQASIQFEGLYREMVKALADLSVRNQDQELARLLATYGISVTVTPPGTAAPAPPRK